MNSVLTFLNQNWGSVISTLAFIISFTTLYRTHLMRFTPKIINTGRFELGLSDVTTNHNSITLFLEFINSGAKTGVFESLYLEFNNSKKILLVPRYTIKTGMIDLIKVRQDEFLAEPFYSFSLLPKTTSLKKVLFVPWDSKAEFKLAPGRYEFKLFAKYSGKEKYEEMDKVHIEIEQFDIDELNNEFEKSKKNGSVSFKVSSNFTVDRIENYSNINDQLNKSNS